MRRFNRWTDRSSRTAAMMLAGTYTAPTRLRMTSACAMAPWSGPGVEPASIRRSLAALLHVRADEVLRVGFQHAVDLVEEVVELLLEGLGLLGRRGLDLFGLGRALLGR